MASSTVPSTYGPLTISKDKKSFKFKLPKLQFDDSDLVIKLGPKPKDWLLVHAEVLRRMCPLLAPGISGKWDETSSAPDKILHPGTGVQVSVRTKALKLVDGTYNLEGKDVLDEDDEDESAELFPASSLAPSGLHNIELYSHDTLHLTRRALVILVSLLYGAQLDCRSISELIDGCRMRTIYMDHIFLSTALTVCAIAEFWGCSDTLTPRILSILKSSMVYWQTVAESPTKHIAIATKLEDAEIYQDALRHMIAKANSTDDWEEVADIMGWTPTELRDFYKPQLEALGPKVQELREELQALSLLTTRAKYWGGHRHDAPMRYVDMVPHQPLDHVRWIAGQVLSEYLTSQISGEKFMVDDRMDRVEKAGTLSLAIHKITQAAKSPYPAGLFDAATAIHLARDFNFSVTQTRQLEQHLHRLVRKANFCIEMAFPVEDRGERPSDSCIHAAGEFRSDSHADQADSSLNGNRCSCNKDFVHFITDRAHFDEYRHGYTYMKIPSAVPWKTEGQSVGAPVGNTVLVAGISVADVTPEWTQAIEKLYGVSE